MCVSCRLGLSTCIRFGRLGSCCARMRWRWSQWRLVHTMEWTWRVRALWEIMLRLWRRTSPTVLLMRFLWLYDRSDDASLQTIYSRRQALTILHASICDKAGHCNFTAVCWPARPGQETSRPGPTGPGRAARPVQDSSTYHIIIFFFCQYLSVLFLCFSVLWAALPEIKLIDWLQHIKVVT